MASIAIPLPNLHVHISNLPPQQHFQVIPLDRVTLPNRRTNDLGPNRPDRLSLLLDSRWMLAHNILRPFLHPLARPSNLAARTENVRRDPNLRQLRCLHRSLVWPTR